MVSDCFFYQLVLVALVWLCLMLQWVWPSDRATALVQRHPSSHLHRSSAAVSSNPLRALPTSPIVMPVSTPVNPTHRPLPLRHRASP
jgi:hypothetical protein